MSCSKYWEILGSKALVVIRKASQPVAGFWRVQCEVSLGWGAVVDGQPIYMSVSEDWSREEVSLERMGRGEPHRVCGFLPSWPPPKKRTSILCKNHLLPARVRNYDKTIAPLLSSPKTILPLRDLQKQFLHCKSVPRLHSVPRSRRTQEHIL